MGILDDIKRNQDERREQQADMLVSEMGGIDGCLKSIFRIIFLPVLIPYWILKSIWEGSKFGKTIIIIAVIILIFLLAANE